MEEKEEEKTLKWYIKFKYFIKLLNQIFLSL
jgi:hypothetical protein